MALTSSPIIISLFNRDPSHLYFSFPSGRFQLWNCNLNRQSSSSSGAGIRSSRGEKDSAHRPSSDFLRKPAAVIESVVKEILHQEENEDGDDNESGRSSGEEGWIDWEDQILENTAPLVGFVRMVLHSGKYESGDRLSEEHEKTILEKLLPYHPECEKKIGCGVDYITVGYHPNFESSRCLFIARKDGEIVDFSYWKCMKGLIRKKYPLYADSFILRHFRHPNSQQK
ncbi:protein DCL, chloroplastic-like [Impatiens glandulifera]|uniref:protein DCL, chloroplastic-like n=1 Tax=Impatiens glandulifera TaxID=253017 RepID=UPI001FB079E0|nr:protein DCL, chloroplastic-like [Impatiens glandulifera]